MCRYWYMGRERLRTLEVQVQIQGEIVSEHRYRNMGGRWSQNTAAVTTSGPGP